MPSQQPESRSLELAPFFAVRTPLLNFEQFTAWNTGSSETYKPPGDETALQQRRFELADRLQAIYQDPVVKEALLIASPSLAERLSSWNVRSRDPKDLKIQHALTKYFSRMCYRCTPYGLFAGFSWARLDAMHAGHCGVTLATRAHYRRHARVDMGVWPIFTAQLQLDGSFRHSMRYFANPTLFRRGSNWCYVEAITRETARQFQVSLVESSPYLDELLAWLDAADSSPEHASLVQELVRLVPDVSAEEACTYIDELIANGVLLSVLEPTLTNGDPHTAILQEAARGDTETSRKADELMRALADLNAAPLGAGVAAIDEADRAVRVLVSDLGAVKSTLQTDLHKPVVEAGIAPELAQDITALAETLTAFPSQRGNVFADFYQRFIERYGEGAQAPLLEVLDPDFGIPFAPPSDDLPLLRGLPLSRRVKSMAEGPTNPADALLLRKFQEACVRQAREITLTPQDLHGIPGLRAHPASAFLLVSVVESSQDRTKRLLLRYAGGTPAARLLARFSTADSALAAQLQEFCRNEDLAEDADAVAAEIVHWPLNRVGNVVLRAALRPHELPIFAHPAAPRSHQFQMRDLLVSVSNRRVVLRCGKTGVRVLPRLSTAHNFESRSIAVYRFLCSLALQDDAVSTVRWPSAIASAARLPRLTSGRAILIPETWNLDASRLRTLSAPEDSYFTVQRLRTELNWPRYLELVQGDNCLLVDLDNPVSVDCFAQELKDLSTAQVQEAFAPSTDAFARSVEGAYANELVLLFNSRSSKQQNAPTPRMIRARRSLEVAHMPGGEWLYLKVYCGTATADRVLLQHVAAALQQLRHCKVIDRWFFLRYYDPDFHLRLRLHGTPNALWSNALPTLTSHIQRARAERLAIRMEVATYEPEIDRYGGPAAQRIAEQMFEVDSECALQLLSTPEFADHNRRWLLTLASVDHLWRAAGFDDAQLVGIYSNIAAYYTAQLAEGKHTKVAIDKAFRLQRAQVDEVCRPDGQEPAAFRILNQRRELIRACLQEYATLQSTGALARPLEDILVSHAHMTVNRLALSQNTLQEYVTYELLLRRTKAQLARSQAQSKSSQARHAAC